MTVPHDPHPDRDGRPHPNSAEARLEKSCERLGVVLREAREALELRVEQVAIFVGVTAGEVVRYEKGKRVPPAPNRRLLAQYLELELADLDALIDDVEHWRELVRRRRSVGGTASAVVAALAFLVPTAHNLGATCRPAFAVTGAKPKVRLATRRNRQPGGIPGLRYRRRRP